MTRLFLSLVLGVVALPIAFSLSAKADGLSRLQGTWNGQGWARQKVDGVKERVRCRMKAVYTSPSKRLVLSGKCAVPGRKFNLKGTVREVSKGTLTGRWSNPFGSGSTAVSGAVDGTIVQLYFKAPASRGQPSQRQALRWKISGKSLTMMGTNLENKAQTSLIKFNR